MIDLVDVYAYCLMPNHFHFLIKVKSKEELETFAKVKNLHKSNLSVNDDNSEKGLHASYNIVSKQMAKFISSYSQGYNKSNNRHGALIEAPFKRIRINSEEYRRNLIIYIHLNPIDINANYETYIYSSYYSLLSNLNTNLKRDEVLIIFEDVDNFIYSHKYPPKFDFNF